MGTAVLFVCLLAPGTTMQLVALIIFVVWRITAFSFINGTVAYVFPPEVVSSAMSLVYTSAGVVSLCIQDWLANYVADDVSNMANIHIFFLAMCSISLVWIAMLTFTLDPETIASFTATGLNPPNSFSAPQSTTPHAEIKTNDSRRS